MHELSLLCVSQLKKEGFKIECFSYRKNGKPSGKATEDCDIAIDVIGVNEYWEPVNFDFKEISIEVDPYKEENLNLSRIKFKI